MRKFASILIISFALLAGCNVGRVGGSSTPFPASTPLPPDPTVTATFVPPTPTSTATHSPSPTITPSGQVELEAVGDIMLGRTVGDQILSKGPQVVFAGVQSALDSADVLIGNLECAITNSDQPEHKTYTLSAPPEAARALALAGFDVLSLANNHAMDYGAGGLADTQAALGASGIASVGAGVDFNAAHAPVILRVNGLRLAFLAYVDVLPEQSGFDPRVWTATGNSPGVAWADPAQIQSDVHLAKSQADLVIVMLHGGTEITDVINNLTIAQRDEAHSAIDAGASLVIGSHPHVLQAIERYHGGLIAYSLGNFVFDQYLGIADASVILRVHLDRNGILGYDYFPVLIRNGLPGLISGNDVPAIGTLIAPLAP